MSTVELQEQVCTCPHCFATNTLVSAGISPRSILLCSTCGEVIGTVADMRVAFISAERQDKSGPVLH